MIDKLQDILAQKDEQLAKLNMKTCYGRSIQKLSERKC
jgi:hypothetical protein